MGWRNHSVGPELSRARVPATRPLRRRPSSLTPQGPPGDSGGWKGPSSAQSSPSVIAVWWFLMSNCPCLPPTTCWLEVPGHQTQPCPGAAIPSRGHKVAGVLGTYSRAPADSRTLWDLPRVPRRTGCARQRARTDNRAPRSGRRPTRPSTRLRAGNPRAALPPAGAVSAAVQPGKP